MNTDTYKDGNVNKQHTERKLSKKQMGIAGGILVILIALIAGISIYNAPANRAARALDLGNRYLEEQNYEQAAIAFEEAITIDDRCMEAYAGGILAYQQLGDQERVTDLYERALQAVAGLDETELAENMEAVVGIYLTAEDVYSDNPARVIEILEDGFSRTGDQQIKGRLLERYFELAKGYTDAEDYENALGIYDRLLELDGTNDVVQSDVGSCLEKYLEFLIGQMRYEEAKALIEKYRGRVTTVDFQAFLDRIAELVQIEAENRAYMQKIYDLMAAEDYEAMKEVSLSEESAVFAKKLEEVGEEAYIYLPEGRTLTGTGVGVYRYGDGDYYFYYGSYVDGSRERNGVTFWGSEYGYDLFTGVWQNDAPNGEGEIEDEYDDGEIRTSLIAKGNLINGVWDGFVVQKAYDSRNGYTYDLSFTAANGIPVEDKTEDCFHSSENAWVEEDRWVYAYDWADYKTWGWVLGILPGEKLGVKGFTD